MKNDEKKLVRIAEGGSKCCPWLLSRRVPVKTRHNQPVQLDLVVWINEKEKTMEKQLENEVIQDLQDNDGVVDVSELAKKVQIHPYFGMDSVSGDLVSFFTSGNVKAAVRSFCNSLDSLPLSMVKDFVLVDGVTREIVFDGKDYESEWKDHQEYRLEQMIRNFKRGGRDA